MNIFFKLTPFLIVQTKNSLSTAFLSSQSFPKFMEFDFRHLHVYVQNKENFVSNTVEMIETHVDRLIFVWTMQKISSKLIDVIILKINI